MEMRERLQGVTVDGIKGRFCLGLSEWRGTVKVSVGARVPGAGDG